MFRGTSHSIVNSLVNTFLNHCLHASLMYMASKHILKCEQHKNELSSLKYCLPRSLKTVRPEKSYRIWACI